MRLLILQVLLSLLICTPSFGTKFTNDVITGYLQQKKFSIDTNADAIILYEKATVSIDKVLSGRYEQVIHMYKIVKINNQSAVRLSDIQIAHRKSTVIENIGGNTYNLVDGKVVMTKMPANAVFRRSLTDDADETAFTLPDVKEGTVIEYYYDKVSDLQTLLPTWQFQNAYPTLRSDYEVIYPGTYGFTAIMQGVKFDNFKDEAEAGNSDSYHIINYASNNRTSSLWVRKNVLPLRNEPYCGNMYNYAQTLQVQISAIAYYNEKYLNTWKKLNNRLWNDKSYGGQVDGRNRFLDHLVDSLTAGKTSPIDKAKSIFSYVRGNIERVNNHDFYSSKDIKDILKNKTGNETGINLLLTAMLNNADLEAYPIALSTLDNVMADSTYPVLNSFDYTACALKIDGKWYFLDASHRYNYFGSLPPYCYNGYARIIERKGGESTYLSANAIKERKVAFIMISDITDSSMKYSIVEKFGMAQSLALRTEWANDPQKKQEFINKLTQNLSDESEVLDHKIENLDNADTNLIIKYSYMKKGPDHYDTYYLTTDFVKFFKSNPFKATDRRLPVQLPFNMDMVCILNIKLPDNYIPDDLPKPIEIRYQEKSMVYDEIVNYSKEMKFITARSLFNTKETFYSLDSYETLREFFEKVIQQENNTIVLKKI